MSSKHQKDSEVSKIYCLSVHLPTHSKFQFNFVFKGPYEFEFTVFQKHHAKIDPKQNSITGICVDLVKFNKLHDSFR
jgi:hypothetical protein